MNILHYTIGLPPVRHGGSVQYAYDLMQEQSKNHNVYALTCGDTLFRGEISKIKSVGSRGKVKILTLTNPLTPTLIYGISKPDKQHRDIQFDKSNVRNFILRNKIEVMHLHTLQGIHKSIVEYIKSLGVKIVYTTHDFHGVCPHYNLINNTGILCNNANGTACAKCNINEPSDNYLRFANSSLYHRIKFLRLMRVAKKLLPHSKAESNTNTSTSKPIALSKAKKYDDLLDYYRSFFSLIDLYHFNSEQTKQVFTSFIPSSNGEVINVITSGIKDKRMQISPGSIINIGFIGSLNEYKGFPLLKRAIIDLCNEGIHNIKLNVYGGAKTGIDDDCPQIEYKPPYKYEDLSEILYHLDGTMVPSKWYETFSLVTLESLAHGRPTFVSNHVGAKDIVARYDTEYVFSSYEQLKEILRKISTDTSFLRDYSNMIMDKPWNFTIQNHTEKIIKFYNS